MQHELGHAVMMSHTHGAGGPTVGANRAGFKVGGGSNGAPYELTPPHAMTPLTLFRGQAYTFVAEGNDQQCAFTLGSPAGNAFETASYVTADGSCSVDGLDAHSPLVVAAGSGCSLDIYKVPFSDTDPNSALSLFCVTDPNINVTLQIADYGTAH